MKRIYLYLLLGALTACSEQLEEYEERNIILNATVGEVESAGRTATEAVPFTSEALSADHPLEADVWFSNVSGNYNASTPSADTHVPCHIVMKHEGKPQFAFNAEGKELKYKTPDGGTGTPESVYCVGLYPKNVWNISDDFLSATADIDGSTDLMFAPQISGYWGNPLPVQQFNHQLTWIKVCVCSTSQEAKDAWGELTSIDVKSSASITVNLGSGTVSLTGSKEIPVFSGNMELQTYLQEAGSVFCSPLAYETAEGENKDIYYVDISVNVDLNGSATTDGEYAILKRIYVTNEKGVAYKYSENSEWTPQGKLFTLVLYFNEFSMIEGVCTLNAWEAQNEDLYMNTPQN